MRAFHSRRSARQGSVPLRRGFAVLAALSLLGAQLGAVLHQATAAHETCPEHGELIEASGNGAAPGAANGTASNAGAPFSQLQASAPQAAHHHDLCALALSAQQRALAAAGEPPVRPAAANELSAAAPEVAVRGASIAIWLFAPKASPPAV